MYGENAPPSWARVPGARCRALSQLTKVEGLQEFDLLSALEEGFSQALAISSEALEIGPATAPRTAARSHRTRFAPIPIAGSATDTTTHPLYAK